MYAIDVGSLGVDLLKNGGRDIRFKIRLFFCIPKRDDGLHEPDDAVAAFHMALFSQKMHQDVLAAAYFIELR